MANSKLEPGFSGWVYIMTNPAFPGTVKIGQTKHCPHKRARAISGTGLPTDWTVFTALQSRNHEAMEKKIHRILDKHRQRQDREFFTLTAAQALIAMNAAFDRASDGLENCKAYQERKEQERAKATLAERARREKKRRFEAEKAQREQAVADAVRDLESIEARSDKGYVTKHRGPSFDFFGWVTVTLCLSVLWAMPAIGNEASIEVVAAGPIVFTVVGFFLSINRGWTWHGPGEELKAARERVTDARRERDKPRPRS